VAADDPKLARYQAAWNKYASEVGPGFTAGDEAYLWDNICAENQGLCTPSFDMAMSTLTSEDSKLSHPSPAMDGLITVLASDGAGGEKMGSVSLPDQASILMMSAKLIHFTQKNLDDQKFLDGKSVQGLIEGLRDGSIHPSEVPPISVVRLDGKLYSIDNRRLYAFQAAEVDIPYKIVEPTDAFWDHFETETDGVSIVLRSTGGTWTNEDLMALMKDVPEERW